MKPHTPLDYAVFQLSPNRSRCELFASRDGNSEKLASGLVKPFVAHLKVAEEQVALAVQSIKLAADDYKNAETWFTKGTLERFVQFVSTPEVLELANTYDLEMSQLEAARRIYAQGIRDHQLSGASGGDGTGAARAADATKKELLRAIDVRLAAVRHDLTTSCARASAAGFNHDTVLGLQLFANKFGAHRLSEACGNFLSLIQRRSEFINAEGDDRAVRSSAGSDMSLDDFKDDHPPLRNPAAPQDHALHTHPSTHQQSKQTPSFTFPLRRPQEKEVESNNKKEKKEDETESVQVSQPTRRLSVQDRINLFENKRRESSGSDGKPFVGKSAELRRLSSDVSSADKVVLRRWSGASDMSIDLSDDGKKDTESPFCRPLASSISLGKIGVFSEEVKDKELNDTASSAAPPEVKSCGSSLKDKNTSGPHWKPFVGGHEEADTRDQLNSQSQSRTCLGLTKKFGSNELVISQLDTGRMRDGADGKANFGDSASRRGGLSLDDASSITHDAETVNGANDSGSKDPQINRSGFGGNLKIIADDQVSSYPQGKVDSVVGSNALGGSLSLKKEVESDLLASRPQPRPFCGEVEDLRLTASEGQVRETEFSGPQKMKFRKQGFASEQVKKPPGGRDGENSGGNIKQVVMGKKVLEDQHSFSSTSTPPIDQVTKARQSKGNHELHSELQMKASELEKLFSEHKLRVPCDQSVSSRKNKHSGLQIAQKIDIDHRKPSQEMVPASLAHESPVTEPCEGIGTSATCNSSPSVEMVGNQDYVDAPKQFYELSLDDSRGKFYDKYMQKRDAKLREEWGTKRAEKEAKMKAMQDSLERSRTELKAKFSGSADRQESPSTARKMEKFGSFNDRSTEKAQPVHFLRSDKDEDTLEHLERKSHGNDKSGETFMGDDAPTNTQLKKDNRNLSSSTPRTPAVPVPRLASKSSNYNAGSRRTQSDNPLAQSVPNFSDYRKENTKPSYGVSKTTTRSRSYGRNNAAGEEPLGVRGERPWRSHSLRKSSPSPLEFEDSPNLNGVGSARSKSDVEQIESNLYDKSSKNILSKPSIRKDSRIGPGTGASKLKALITSEAIENEVEPGELACEPEDVMGIVNEEEEEFHTIMVGGCENGDDRMPSSTQESDKFGSENGDDSKSHFPKDPLPPTIHTRGSVQDSPGESPISWMHQPFSYSHETSDIDASVDSPIGSPALWNSHHLSQTEADAVRMRKKWGSAQKPVLAANSSNNQSRKDMKKGIKRLLKFGKKARGTETLVDWISATTSEGDDDTDDGREPASQSAEDLRKSRMGSSHGNPSVDGFNEGELFSEQVLAQHSSIPAAPLNFKLREDHMSGNSLKAPKSFFSLSSFRSKASDSKPR